MSRPYQVFFSHGSEDTYVVQHFLKPKVEATGASVFLDSGVLQYGDDFRDRLLAELSAFDELLVLITRSSLRRPWVMAELGVAVVRQKRLVAIRYGPTEVELQELGILSLIGTATLLNLDDFDAYVMQLTARVQAHGV
jgi:hypothetical protein